MTAADKPAMGRQWRRGYRTEHAVPAAVDQLPLALRVGTPQQEHQALALAVESVDRRIGEPLPPFALVRTGASVLDREHAVEQQHAAIRPWREATMVWPRDAQVALDLLEDVFQRWRHAHGGAHRETQPMRLTRAVIRVLAQNHHANGVERGVFK